MAVARDDIGREAVLLEEVVALFELGPEGQPFGILVARHVGFGHFEREDVYGDVIVAGFERLFGEKIDFLDPGIGHREAQRRNAGSYPPGREYTVQRCDTRYSDSYEERIDGYRVTYIYNGRRQVTQLPYNPGERIRVRVDVSPAE